MRKCPVCDSDMTLLLVSYVCDPCDARKRERERAPIPQWKPSAITIEEFDLEWDDSAWFPDTTQ